MTDRTFFFYGTLMVPAILHRIIHGSPTPEPWQKALLTIRPALLPGFKRYRVKNASYPAIWPSDEEGAASVLGVVVTGLTEGDELRLDAFEGSMYEKQVVEVRVSKSPSDPSSSEGYVKGQGEMEGKAKEEEEDDSSLRNALDRTAFLAESHVDVENETEPILATTYVWKYPETDLDMDTAWDFESFKRDKLQWWLTAPESEL